MAKHRANSLVNKKSIFSEIEETEHRQLKAVAEADERPVTEMIRVIIRRYLDERVSAGEVAAVEGYTAPSSMVP